MIFRDLGALLVEADNVEVPVPGQRMLSVLALLVSRPGETVDADTLIEATWRDRHPAQALQALETVVWRLRRILEPGRSARSAATILQTEKLGYRLAVPPDSVDSRRFAAAARQAADLLADGNAGAALAVSQDALNLWRALPYEAVPEAPWMEPVRAYLSELRLDLAECRVQALLQTGQPELAVREVAPLIERNPFRERYWAQRMLGLYRCGRQAAALEAFAEARRRLADELGVEPGPELRTLQDQILRQVSTLDGPGSGQERAAVAVPGVLPRRRRRLVGRDRDVPDILTLVERQRLVTLVGAGGAGKTTLAVEAAHRARDRFPDGIWFVDFTQLAAGAGIGEVADEIAAVLELTARPGTASPRLVSEQLSGRSLLLVLDNCEHVLDAVSSVADDVLGACPDVTILATSRSALALPEEWEHPVEPLDEHAGAVLFADRLSGQRPDVDPGGSDAPVISAICAAVGWLPLGIEMAAARARVFELWEVADSLAAGPTRLERPGPGPGRHRDMFETVDWSYRLARPAEQLVHRRLACTPGPVTLDAVRALCVAPLTGGQAPRLVSALVHQSLLTAIRPSAAGRPTLFRQLSPTWAHADSMLSGRDRAVAETARDSWVVRTVREAPLDGRAGQAAATDWVTDNMTAVRATLTATLITSPDPVGLELMTRLAQHWFEWGRMAEARRWFDAATAMPDAIELSACDTAIAAALGGCAQGLIQNHDLARDLLTPIRPELKDPPQERLALAGQVLVLMAVTAWVSRLSAIGIEAATAAINVGHRLEDPHIVVRGRALRAANQFWVGDRDTALAELDDVLRDPHGNEFAAFVAAYNRSRAARVAHDSAAALHWMQRAAQAHQILAMHPTSELLEELAQNLDLADSPAEALRCLGAAAALHARDGLPWPRQPDTPPLWNRLRETLPAAQYQRLWAAGQELGHRDPQRLLDEWV